MLVQLFIIRIIKLWVSITLLRVIL